MNKTNIEALTAEDIEHGIVVVDNSAYATANEFTWVPCSLDGRTGIKYSRYDFSNNQTVDVGDGPITMGVANFTENIEETKMILTKNCVEKYGGFYVGRYEAGTDTVRGTASAGLSTVLSQRNKYVYNWVETEQAKTLSEEMYNQENLAVGSRLMSSYEWDTICKWIEDTTNKDIRNSKNWGEL